MDLRTLCEIQAQGENRLSLINGEEGRQLAFRFRETASKVRDLLRKDNPHYWSPDGSWLRISKLANLLPQRELEGSLLEQAVELKAIVDEIRLITDGDKTIV
jgi:hypothetical protein